MIKQLNNVILVVEAMQKMTAFYPDVLGLVPVPNPDDVSADHWLDTWNEVERCHGQDPEATAFRFPTARAIIKQL
jgi:catechol 2,3-dioxygenase-like lactoylglutathione lyase family enzyme